MFPWAIFCKTTLYQTHLQDNPNSAHLTRQEPANFEKMQQPVESFPLSSRQQSKLKAAGFETAEELKGTSVAELSRGIF